MTPIMQVLVIGYGSIGQRHVTVLRDMGQHVSVVSGHLNTTEFPVYKTVEEAFSDRTFDYVVIAVPTGQHAALLRRLMPFLTDRMVCFVEKPVFASSMQKVSCDGLKIIVGYILRAHPLLRKARKILEGKRLYSCRASCGQYLPTWRPGTDYRNCYSAHQEQGGGVLRDLSHELDYLHMLCGDWKRVAAIGGKYSALEISSDDQFGILFETEKCPLCACHIDYLARMTHRDLYVEYEGGSLHLDFIAGALTVNGETEKWNLERNELFRIMHTEAMEYNLTYLTSFSDAEQVLTLVEAAELAAERKIWIEKK